MTRRQVLYLSSGTKYIYIGGSIGPSSGWEWTRASYTRTNSTPFGMNFITPDELVNVEWLKMYFAATAAPIVAGYIGVAYAMRTTGEARGYDSPELPTATFNLAQNVWHEVDLWPIIKAHSLSEPTPGDHVTMLVTNRTGQTIQILSCMMKVAT